MGAPRVSVEATRRRATDIPEQLSIDALLC